MRNIQTLIDLSREQTENVEFSDSTGITENEIIQYANDGQAQMEMAINNVGTDNFLTETIISTSNGVEAYDLPFDMLMGTLIRHVEYGTGSRDEDFFPIEQRQFYERINSFSGTPGSYIQRNNQILLQPKPATSAGRIRVQYKRKLPGLDIRRAQVDAVTLTSAGITSLSFDTSVNFDRTELIKDNFMTIVDKKGNIKMRAIEFDSIDNTTGDVTVTSGFTFESGETIAVGDYAVRYRNSTTHTLLPDICEMWLISYMNWKILKRDSNTDLTDQERELAAMRDNIISGFQRADESFDRIPIINVSDSGFIDEDL